MANDRRAHAPMEEQIRLINEWHRSSVRGVYWWCENNIAVSTFHDLVSRCWKAAADQIAILQRKSADTSESVPSPVGDSSVFLWYPFWLDKISSWILQLFGVMVKFLDCIGRIDQTMHSFINGLITTHMIPALLVWDNWLLWG